MILVNNFESGILFYFLPKRCAFENVGCGFVISAFIFLICLYINTYYVRNIMQILKAVFNYNF